MKNKDWYEIWFDSPYYYTLYKHRDQKEASRFIRNLATELHPAHSAKVLDLACGRGRHSVVLNQLGYDVTGVDLSSNSIEYARQFENQLLHFDVHDMREVYKPAHFDIVLNLFTSFGYFDDPNDNLKVLNSVAASLKKNGVFVLDFMNCHMTEQQLQELETRYEDGIHFNIARRREEGCVIKTISFNDQGQDYVFEEKVSTLKFEDLQNLFDRSNLKVLKVFGDYDLNPYEKPKSERLIFLSEKA